MIKAVFFDALHTLFESKPSQMEMYRDLLIKYTGIDVPLNDIESIVNRILAKTENASIEMDNTKKSLVWGSFPEQILEAVGYIKDDKLEVAAKLRRETWENPFNYYLYDDVIPALHELKKKGVKIACVSNEDVHLNNFFIHFDIDKYFEFVLVSEEVNCEKPNKKIFQEALKRAGLDAKEVIFVGDSYISDYEGPEKVGIKAVLLDRYEQNRENIDKLTKLTDITAYLEKGETHAHTAA